MFRPHSRPDPEPDPQPAVPDTPAEAVYLAAITDARNALRFELTRQAKGTTGAHERLAALLSRLSDALILAEVSR